MAVRREKVILQLDDQFTTGMARAAAAAALLNRELESMDRSSRTASTSMNRNSTSTDRYSTSLAEMNRHLRESGTLMNGLNGNGRNGLNGLNGNANNAGRSINQLTGRLRLMVDVAAMLGPALVPIGALGVPAVSGLASQLGIAAVAGGTAVLAFQGVADAFKAVKKAADAPTFENIQAAQIAMEGLAPAAQEFVTKLSEMRGEFAGFRNAAAQGLFSELNDDFEHMSGVLDRLTPVVHAFGEATGDMLGDGLSSLDSARWQDFFTFLEAEARPSMERMGETLGNFGHGLAELWMGTDGLNDSFSGWLLDVSKSFDGWAEGLAKTAGFTEFLDYVKQNGPQVGDTFGSIGNAFLQVAEAMAPVGGPILSALESVFDVIAGIADSDIGTPLIAGAAALAALSRAGALFGATSRTLATSQATLRNRVTATSGAFRAFGADVRAAANFGAMNAAQMNAQTAAAARVRASLMQVGRVAATSAAGVGLMAVAMSDADNKAGIANTAMLGLAGTMIGGPWGAAIGVAIGGTMDLAAANDDLEDAVKRAQEALRSGGPTQWEAEIGRLREQIQGAEEDSKELKKFLTFQPTDKGYFESMGGTIRGFVNNLTGAGDDAEKEMDNLEDALRGPDFGLLATGAGMSSDALWAATASAKAFAAALEDVNGVLTAHANVRDYKAALDEFNEGLKENGRTMNTNIEAGRANEQNLERIASAALKVANTLDKTERPAYLAGVRKDLTDAASKMDMGRAATTRFNETLDALDKAGAKPDVDADTKKATQKVDAVDGLLDHLGAKTAKPKAMLQDLASGRIKTVQGLINKYGVTRAEAKALLRDLASGGISAVRANLAALDGTSATTYITTVRRVVGGGMDAAAGAFGNVFRAEGGPVYGPGTKTSDSIPAMLSNGEFVVKAAAVDHYGLDTMFRLNAMRLAEGGSTSGDNVKRRAAATKAFDLSGGLGVAGVRREMREFERALNKMGRHTGRSFDRLGKQAEKLSASWLKAGRDLEAAKTRRDDVRSAASGSFNNDLFGNGLAGLMTQLEADRNDSRTMTTLLGQLRGRGLNGAAYEALSGSGDINTAQQLLAAGRGGVSQYEQLYAQRAASQASLGSAAAYYANKEIAALTVQQKRQTAAIEKLERNIERGVYRGAFDGAKGRERERGREVRGRGRAGR